MTVNEVKEAVAGYGYSRDLAGNDGLFYTALNLAMKEVNRLRPRTETVTLVHEPIGEVAAYRDVAICKPGDPIRYTAVARSLSFEVSGNAAITVKGARLVSDADARNGYGQSLYTGRGPSEGWRRYKAVQTTEDLNGIQNDPELSQEEKAQWGGKIRLDVVDDAGTACFVRNVYFFDVPYVPVIPSGDIVEYDLRAMLDRFSAVSFPIMRDGVDLGGGEVSLVGGYKLRIPKGNRGTYEVNCEVYPTRVTFNAEGDTDLLGEDSTVIELDEDLAELLPLLVASYLWMDDEPETAAAYEARYARAAQHIRPVERTVRVIDRKGWA